jgi:hypothetical protein
MKAVRMWKRRFCYRQGGSARQRLWKLAARGHRLGTYHWDTECHDVEGQRGDHHDDEDDPNAS